MSWHVAFLFVCTLHTQLSPHNKRVIASSNLNDNNHFNWNHYNKHYKLNFISAFRIEERRKTARRQKSKKHHQVCSLLIAKQRQNMYIRAHANDSSQLALSLLPFSSSSSFATIIRMKSETDFILLIHGVVVVAPFLLSISVVCWWFFFAIIMWQVSNCATNMEEQFLHAFVCSVRVCACVLWWQPFALYP